MKSLKWEGNGTKNLFPHTSRSNPTPGPDLSVWRPWAGSLGLSEARVWGAGVVVCLEQGADNSMISI